MLDVIHGRTTVWHCVIKTQMKDCQRENLPLVGKKKIVARYKKGITQFSKKLINNKPHWNVFVYSTTLFCNINHQVLTLKLLKAAPQRAVICLSAHRKIKIFRRQTGATELHFKPSEKFSAQLIITLDFTKRKAWSTEGSTAQWQEEGRKSEAVNLSIWAPSVWAGAYCTLTGTSSLWAADVSLDPDLMWAVQQRFIASLV